jgi:hypothetical protein
MAKTGSLSNCLSIDTYTMLMNKMQQLHLCIKRHSALRKMEGDQK